MKLEIRINLKSIFKYESNKKGMRIEIIDTLGGLEITPPPEKIEWKLKLESNWNQNEN